MKKFTNCLIIAATLFASCLSCIANESSGISANEALEKLKAGNNHYIKMHLKHPDQNVKKRQELLKGQHPFAAILSCSDSRVPPEIIFDQGLGDLFEIRNAGNVLDNHVIGSIEYAIVHCGVKLVVIMGHEDCGAVKASLAHNKESKYIESITSAINPAIKMSEGTKNNLPTQVAKNNAILIAKELIKDDPIISDYVKNKGVKIIPALYHMDSGIVEFLN